MYIYIFVQYIYQISIHIRIVLYMFNIYNYTCIYTLPPPLAPEAAQGLRGACSSATGRLENYKLQQVQPMESMI